MGNFNFNITLRYRTNLETNQSSKQFIELPLYKLFIGRTLPIIIEAYQSLLCSLNLCYCFSMHFTRSMGRDFQVSVTSSISWVLMTEEMVSAAS